MSYEQDGACILSIEATQSLAEKFDLSPLDLDCLALEHDVLPVRYVKNFNALQVKEQINLLRSKVALVGLGGLGGYILELIARTGVGSILAADGDVYEPSNLNRQLYCRQDKFGQSKALAAKERLGRINSSIDFQVWEKTLQGQNYKGFLRDRDLVVDALGGLKVRRELLQQTDKLNVPLVTGAVAGEMGYVSTIYPGEHGPIDLWQGQSGAEDTLGCLSYGVCLVASLQSAEAVHILSGRKPSFRNKLAVCDLKDFSWQVFDF